MVRMTMDRYLDGALGYGLIGYKSTPEYPDTAAWGGTNNALDSYPSLIIAPTTLLLPEWSRQQAADEPLAAITPAKARLTDKLAALDHLPAALLRGAFAGNI